MNWYRKVIAQNLTDYQNGLANQIIEDQQTLRNPTFQQMDENNKQPYLDDLYIKNLKKALKNELGIVITFLDPNKIPDILNNIEAISQSRSIKLQKIFKDIPDLISHIENKLEMKLNQNDQMTYNNLLNNDRYSNFIQWLDAVHYNSDKNPENIDLTHIKDWYDTVIRTIDLNIYNQEKVIFLVQQWDENRNNSEVDYNEFSNKILRKKKNVAQKGEVVQSVILDNTIKGSLDKNTLESVLQLEKQGMKMVELNDERSLNIEGDTMGHCVGGYGEHVKEKHCEVYSLRTPDGRPCVTIEMQQNENGELRIVQIKGKSNKVPIDRYRPFVMQWILNNGLKVVGDVEGCLCGNLFNDILKPFENVDNYQDIKNISLGELTPYKRDFIDKTCNLNILFTQTKNNDFMREAILSNLITIDLPMMALPKNLNLSTENQKLFIWNATYSNIYYLEKNPSLTEENKSYIEKIKDTNSVLADEDINMLIEFKGECMSHYIQKNINLTPEHQRSIIENMPFIQSLTTNPCLSEDNKRLIIEKGDEFAVSTLAKNQNLSPEIQRLIILSGNSRAVHAIIPHEKLTVQNQKLIAEMGIDDIFLSGMPNLTEESQKILIEKGDNFCITNISRIRILSPEIQRLIIASGINLKYFAAKENLTEESKIFLAKSGNESYTYYLVRDPNLSPELQRIIIVNCFNHKNDRKAIKDLLYNPALTEDNNLLIKNKRLLEPDWYKKASKSNNINRLTVENLISVIEFITSVIKEIKKRYPSKHFSIYSSYCVFDILLWDLKEFPQNEIIGDIKEESINDFVKLIDQYIEKMGLNINDILSETINIEDAIKLFLKQETGEEFPISEEEKYENFLEQSANNKNWYKNIKTAIFGTEPFSGSYLSDKVRTSPYGHAGGDSNVGVFSSKRRKTSCE